MEDILLIVEPLVQSSLGASYTRPFMDLPHEFQNESLLALALTHSSTHASEDNERLEFLGDAVLDLIIAEELFGDDERFAEGPMTEMKSVIVSRRGLAEAAAALKLGEHATLGHGMQQSTLPRSVLANLYEAVLGAVYLDAGLEVARSFALNTLQDLLEQARRDRGSNNPKQALQIHVQRIHGTPPDYVLIEDRGSAHARAFLVAAEFAGERYAPAWGRTLKEAEQWAAHEALLVIKESAETDS